MLINKFKVYSKYIINIFFIHSTIHNFTYICTYNQGFISFNWSLLNFIEYIQSLTNLQYKDNSTYMLKDFFILFVI